MKLVTVYRMSVAEISAVADRSERCPDCGINFEDGDNARPIEYAAEWSSGDRYLVCARCALVDLGVEVKR